MPTIVKAKSTPSSWSHSDDSTSQTRALVSPRAGNSLMGLIFRPPLSHSPETPRSHSVHPPQCLAPQPFRDAVPSLDHHRILTASPHHIWYSHKTPPQPHRQKSLYRSPPSSNCALFVGTPAHRVPTYLRFLSFPNDPETDFTSV